LGLQLVAILTGLFGAALCFGWGFSLSDTLLHQPRANIVQNLVRGVTWGAVSLSLGSYFLWIFRISCPQLSPRGVLHLTGILAVFAIGLPSAIVQAALDAGAIPFPELRFYLHQNRGWGAFGGLLNLIWFFVVLAKYQSVAGRISRFLGLPNGASMRGAVA